MHKTLFAAQFVEWGSIDTPLLIITGLPKNEHLSTTLNQSLSDKWRIYATTPKPAVCLNISPSLPLQTMYPAVTAYMSIKWDILYANSSPITLTICTRLILLLAHNKPSLKIWCVHKFEQRLYTHQPAQSHSLEISNSLKQIYFLQTKIAYIALVSHSEVQKLLTFL